MMLNDVMQAVSSQLDDQSQLGVQITRQNEVPETGPTNKGLWLQIPAVTAVFADLKGSTKLNAGDTPKVAARAYTYFVRAMAVTLDRFEAKYVDIQGDGIFGLFSGENSTFLAASCAITMRTQVELDIAVRFKKETSTDWPLQAGIGIDQGTLLVRRLGLRGSKQNEVWAGKPVNMAAKLSSLAKPNQVVVSERAFESYTKASKLRRRALIWSCGCDEQKAIRGGGLNLGVGQTTMLWQENPAPGELGLDFNKVHKLDAKWCNIHGAEFCEAIVSGRKPEK